MTEPVAAPTEAPPAQPKAGFRVSLPIVYTLIFAVLVLLGSALVMPLGPTAESIRAARLGDGEFRMGQMQVAVREARNSTGRKPRQLTRAIADGGCGVNSRDLTDDFAEILDAVYATADDRGVVVARVLDTNGQWGACVFEWDGRSREFRWEDADSLEEFLAKIGVTP